MANNLKNELINTISSLKQKQSNDFIVLKQHYYETVENFKPASLMKSATQEFTSLPNFKSNVFKIIMGIGVNYFSKTMINENSSNPVKRILGQVFKVVSKLI